MIKNFFNKDKKNTSNDENKNLMKMVALLIHAAKIDENYSNEEKEIIINFAEMSSEKNLNRNQILSIIKSAEEYEKNSNQILEYTQEVKRMDLDSKKLVLKFLWKTAYADGRLDVDEERIVRRVADLIMIKDIEVLKLKDLSKRNN